MRSVLLPAVSYRSAIPCTCRHHLPPCAVPAFACRSAVSFWLPPFSSFLDSACRSAGAASACRFLPFSAVLLLHRFLPFRYCLCCRFCRCACRSFLPAAFCLGLPACLDCLPAVLHLSFLHRFCLLPGFLIPACGFRYLPACWIFWWFCRSAFRFCVSACLPACLLLRQQRGFCLPASAVFAYRRAWNRSAAAPACADAVPASWFVLPVATVFWIHLLP